MEGFFLSNLHLVRVASGSLQAALMSSVDLVCQDIEQHLAVTICAQVPEKKRENKQIIHALIVSG